jgi:acetyl-CoA decarbonylase/synthase complex subunit gamma
VFKAAVIAFPALFVLGGAGGSGGFWANAVTHGLFTAVALLSAILAGTVLTPLLLPWLPGRAFSLKGLAMGLLAAATLAVFKWEHFVMWEGRLEILAWLFLVPAASAYLAMNFTGASTYTSLSGVKKEMRWAIPLQIGAAVIGLGFWIGSCFLS